jgi:hypothetical protein
MLQMLLMLTIIIEPTLALKLRETKVWWKRLFGAVLGIITTNAYLAYKYDCERQRVEPMYRDAFVEQVALGLLHIGDYVIDDEDDKEFMSKLLSKKQRVSREAQTLKKESQITLNWALSIQFTRMNCTRSCMKRIPK